MQMCHLTVAVSKLPILGQIPNPKMFSKIYSYLRATDFQPVVLPRKIQVHLKKNGYISLFFG